jgi:hypothetical protein
MPSKLQKERSKNCFNDDRRKRRVSTFIQSCWWRLFVRKELQRLKKAKTLSLIPINDSRMNHLEERGNDTIRAIKKQSDSDSNVKCTTVQVHGNNHNSQSDWLIRMKLYVQSPGILSYLRLNFQVNRRSGRHENTGQ